jgi:hypothetical protein
MTFPNSITISVLSQLPYLVLRVMASLPQDMFPVSSLRARNFLFPPLTRTGWTRIGPIFVMAAGRAISNLRFMRMGARLPPVARRLCQWLREIPMMELEMGTEKIEGIRYWGRISQVELVNTEGKHV